LFVLSFLFLNKRPKEDFIFPLKKEIGLRGVGTGLVSTCLLIGMGLITPVGKYTGIPVGTSLCLATCPAVL